MPKMNKNPKCIVARESWNLRSKAFPCPIQMIQAQERKESLLERQAKQFLRDKHKMQSDKLVRRGRMIACAF